MNRKFSFFLITVITSVAYAQSKPQPDTAFNNWLYKSPDPAVWTRTESNGSLIFSIPSPPGDYCAMTLFPGAAASADFKQQFAAAIDADQKSKNLVKIEADSGPKAGKSAEGYDTLTRSLRCETQAAHSYHIYVAGRSGDRFDIAAFQTTSDATWQKFAPQASQFLLSLKLANSLTADQVAQLTNKAAGNPPILPGFGDPPAAPTPQAPPAPAAIAPIPLPNPQAVPGLSLSKPIPTPQSIPDVPLAQSPIVINNAVIQKNGHPVDPIKLSVHDMDIQSPAITVAPNGSIHVAFIEQHKTTYAYAIYHRSSSDNGKTWTESKNLSEPMPGFHVGHCQIVSDPQNRVYVIWRAGLREDFPVSADPYGSAPSNLFYRLLENGKWSKIIPISPAGSVQFQNDGALSYYAALDAAGHVQIIWNVPSDKWHPEYTATGQHNVGMFSGLVFQSTLTGTTPSAPREAYMSPVSNPNPTDKYGNSCDGLDTLNGYFDANGSFHVVAAISSYVHRTEKSRYQIIENAKPGWVLDLPALSYHAWRDIPTLLVDAQGKQHVVTLYPAGEHPDVRDYLVGSDDEPTVIRATTGPKATLDGFQAFQGPGGRMIALMQMNDSGERGAGDDFLSISTGNGQWSTPVNITNNQGRATFASSQHGASNVVVSTNFYPGPGAVAYSPDGHLNLIMINNEHSLFGASTFGVDIAGGSTSTPTLRFLRF